MPTKRRKTGARRIGGRLNDKQRVILLCGVDFFHSPEPDFATEDEARAAWEFYRADLLADRDFSVNDPGRRPWAFWEFEVGLKRYHRCGWIWPRGCNSEEETVYLHHADDAEKRAIEERWRLCPASAPKWWIRDHAGGTGSGPRRRRQGSGRGRRGIPAAG